MSGQGDITPKSTVGWIVSERQTFYLNQCSTGESLYHALDTIACSEVDEATNSEENNLESFQTR